MINIRLLKTMTNNKSLKRFVLQMGALNIRVNLSLLLRLARGGSN